MAEETAKVSEAGRRGPGAQEMMEKMGDRAAGSTAGNRAETMTENMAGAAPGNMAGDILDVNHMTITLYENGMSYKMVNRISFHVGKGEIVGIVGESGCGKSMTALALQDLLKNHIKVTEGSMVFDGKDLRTISAEDRRQINGSDMTMIFQEPMTSLNPLHRIGDQVGEVLLLHGKHTEAEIRERTLEALEMVELPDPEKAILELNSLQIPGVEYRMEKTVKCGITGTHMHVLVNGQEEGPEMFGHDHDHHDHDHHHHHHGHDADEVFEEFGVQTSNKYTKEEIEEAIDSLDECGEVLRAKGIVENSEGGWLEFDYVPGEGEVRDSEAEATGMIVVIGTRLNKEKVSGLFKLS